MDEMGRYMDNIFVERLRRSLKRKEVYLNACTSVAMDKAGIGAWFGVYNEGRRHQSLSDRTPRQTYKAHYPWIWGRSALADRLGGRPGRFPGGLPEERFFEGLDTELHAECIRQPPHQHGTVRPIRDRYQVEKAPCHRDVGDAGAPDLIDPLDGNPIVPLGVDLLGWHRLARVQPLIDRRKAEPQPALDPFAVDDMALGRQPRRHLRRPVRRPCQVLPIDQRHDRAAFDD
jgi:Integrase core domain